MAIALQNGQTKGSVSKWICRVPWLGTRPLVRNGLTSLRWEISRNFILRSAKHDPAKQLTKVAWKASLRNHPPVVGPDSRSTFPLRSRHLRSPPCDIHAALPRLASPCIERLNAFSKQSASSHGGWSSGGSPSCLVGPINRSFVQTQWLTLVASPKAS